jgi:RNA polymerase sigma-70 factor (ECF subfamily)
VTTDASTSPTSELVPLVEAARCGEEGAFAALYDRLAPGIFDHLMLLTGNRATAEDLVQQTFLEAWAGLASLRAPALVRSWIYSIAHRAGCRHLRSDTVPLPLDEIPDLETPTPGPEDVAISDDATRLVWTAAASLEQQHREALSLSLRHGLTYREVGEVLGLSAARANDLLVRTREALGRAVQSVLVTRSSAACPELREMAPAGAGSLSAEQRRAVDYHLRHCSACRALAGQLTRPEELFGTIVLAALPAGARHAPPVPPAGSTPAHLAAAHSAGGGARATLPRPRWRRWGPVNHLPLLVGGAAIALLVAGISVATIRPLAPSPAPVITTAQLDNATLWEDGLGDLASLHAYTIAASMPSPDIDVIAYDITVGPPGSWFGTVTSEYGPDVPITLADLNGHYYVLGNANLVAATTTAVTAFTTAEAQALGDRWVDVTGQSAPGTSTLFSVGDGAAEAGEPGGGFIPSAAAYAYDPSMISRTRTTLDGQPVYRLSVDDPGVGNPSVDVTTGPTPYLIEATSYSETIQIAHLNEKVTWPDVSGAITWAQLTGSPPP